MPEKFIILADVSCDLSQEIRDYFKVETYLEGYIHFSDGRDFKTKLDWSNIERDELYKALSNKRLQVSTAPPSPEEVYQTFKHYAEMGYKVLSMSISSKISSTYNATLVARDRVLAENPESTIYCFDSFRMSGTYGLLVMYAHEMKNEGKSFDEIIEWLEENKHKVHQMGPIDDLIVVARRGRISMGKAIMGNFAGVKPMGDCSNDGYVSVIAKVKGINKALEITAKYVKECAKDIEDQYILISHSDREAYAMKLKELVQQLVAPKKIFVSDVFSGCAPNIGPGMVGIYFLGDAVSEELIDEKALINEIISNTQ